MKAMIVILFVSAAVISCGSARNGRANFESGPGHYQVSGHTYSPEAMVQTASDAYLRQEQTERCWDAYDRGEAVACPGSYYNYGMMYGNEAGFYGYGAGGIIPNPNGYTGPTTQNTDQTETYRKADAALKNTKLILKKLAEEEKGE